jgi:predicted phosphodiesterase
MKLGLLTDIHEHVDHLRTALQSFRQQNVDLVVVIGDVFERGKNLDEACRLLAEVGAIGVWGNHDFGLCVRPDDQTRLRYSAESLQFMSTLNPRLQLEDCLFCHIEPWLDAERLEDLWYYSGPPQDHQKLDRIFGATSQRITFAGHYHRWMVAQPHGIASWQGERQIRLSGDRFFVVIGALCDGDYAIYDTESCELQPFHLATPYSG